MSKTYCKGCDQPIFQTTKKAADGTWAMVWESEYSNAWDCDGLGGNEHVPDTEPLGPKALYAVLMNYIGELDMKNEAYEFEDTEIAAELDRVGRLIDELGLIQYAGTNLGELS